MNRQGDETPRSEENGQPSRGRDATPRRPIRGWFVIALMLLGLFWLASQAGSFGSGRVIAYSEFKQHLRKGEVTECLVGPDVIEGSIRSTSEDGTVETFPFSAVRIDDPELIADLEAAGIKHTGVRASGIRDLLLIWLVPLLLIPLLLLMFVRSRGSAGGAALSIGKSKARLVADMDTGVTFEDVAGCDEAKVDLQEVVAFLKEPERFQKLGAKIPKGILLVGPPGTGKTLLARAVAGEAKVPFFSISGSEFVEMFVGVGAARVRDLFEKALKKAPCIVFVDEIDAIGRTRGIHMGTVNDEREQTLNQLLVELDGFEANNGVILLAATNRPDVLDRALLRPGRFDRQVVVDAPDLGGREAILRVHARGKPLAPDVDLADVARATPGFAGADLANALNEAALLASRRNGKQITARDVEEAIEKVVAGPERKSRRMREEEKRRVAFHEAGHAIVAHHSEHADPVHKISIVPRGRAALGFTMQLPREEQMMMTRPELDDRLAGLFGGRAAEEIVFGQVSTGAANDLEQATNLARQMVCLYGMGESAGLMHCVQDAVGRFGGADGTMQRDCSEATAREIDEEVKRMLEAAYGRAREVLTRHRDELDLVANALLERERLDAAEFVTLLDERTAPAAARGTP